MRRTNANQDGLAFNTLQAVAIANSTYEWLMRVGGFVGREDNGSWNLRLALQERR